MLFCAALFAGTCVNAHPASPTEYEVKAAFIHNIAKFVEWPAAARRTGSLKLCILGQSPFGNSLDALQGKTIGNKVWEVLPAKPNTNLRECGVLFIAASESDNLSQILERLQGSNVLTMGDTAGYAAQGVMVNFYLEQDKVRFEINVGATSRAGLKVSSQLLKLARIVAGSGGMQ